MQYREIFANALKRTAINHSDVMLVESDIPSPARKWFKGNRPQQFVNTGVAEANAVGICAGLESEGYIPFWYTYGFLIGRAYNQIKQSIAIDDRSVKIYGYNCGVSGIGGSSHNCVEDIGILRTIPNMVIIAPSDSTETYLSVEASYDYNGPVYVRFPRGEAEDEFFHSSFKIGEGEVWKDGSDLTIIANGHMSNESLKAAKRLPFSIKVVNMSTVNPMDYDLVLRSAKETGAIITVEECYLRGGMGEAVASYLSEVYPCHVYRMGVGDVFTQSGKGDLRDNYGLTSKHIGQLCERVMEERK